MLPLNHHIKRQPWRWGQKYFPDALLDVKNQKLGMTFTEDSDLFTRAPFFRVFCTDDIKKLVGSESPKFEDLILNWASGVNTGESCDE